MVKFIQVHTSDKAPVAVNTKHITHFYPSTVKGTIIQMTPQANSEGGLQDCYLPVIETYDEVKELICLA